MASGLRLAFAMCLALTAQAARAQDAAVEAFYKGKQLFLRVGSAPGDGYDLYGRLVSRHIARYLPGAPAVVVQNVPGGGSLVLANQFGNTTPRDGTIFGLFNSGMVTTPLLNPGAVHFDPRRLRFVGSPNREGHVYIARDNAPAKTIDEILTKELMVGGTAPGAAPYEFPLVMNALLGTRMKMIPGYGGSGPIMLAMERGELHGYAGLAWVSAKQGYLQQIQQGKVLVVAQFGMKKHPDLPDTPLMPLGRTEEDRQLFQLLYARQSFGRPFAFPPETPEYLVAALRKAMAALTRDAEFLAEAKKLNADIDLVTGEELEALTDSLYATPAPLLARIRALINPEAR